MSRQRYAFIVGAPRSGTTLLTHILHRHPEICATPETHFLVHVHAYPGGPLAFIRNWPASAPWLCERLQTLRTPHWQPEAVHLIRQCGDLSHATSPLKALRRVFVSVIRDAAPQPQAELLVEKTPQHIEYLPLLRRLFPDATIIHIVRDGRAVAASLSRMPWWGRGLTGGMAYWVEWVPQACRWIHHDPHAAEVRYEDLVSNPERIIKGVLQSLDHSWVSGLYDPDPNERILIEADGFYKTDVLKPIDPSRKDEWRTRISDETATYMETVLADAHARMDYAVEIMANRKPKLTIGGANGNKNQWKLAEPLIREACAHLHPGEVRVATLSRTFVAHTDVVTCENFARSILNAPGYGASLAAAMHTTTNVIRLGRRIRWIMPSCTPAVRWRKREILQGWISSRVQTIAAPTETSESGSASADTVDTPATSSKIRDNQC